MSRWAALTTGTDAQVADLPGGSYGVVDLTPAGSWSWTVIDAGNAILATGFADSEAAAKAAAMTHAHGGVHS